jgi:hypothetical protein
LRERPRLPQQPDEYGQDLLREHQGTRRVGAGGLQDREIGHAEERGRVHKQDRESRASACKGNKQVKPVRGVAGALAIPVLFAFGTALPRDREGDEASGCRSRSATTARRA